LHHPKCTQPQPSKQQALSKLKTESAHNLHTNKCEENRNTNKAQNLPSPLNRPQTCHFLLLAIHGMVLSSLGFKPINFHHNNFQKI